MAVTPVPCPPAGAPVRHVNLRSPTAWLPLPDMLDLTASTATGSTGGWDVHTQRRGQGGQPALCVRIDAPDGRVLFVTTDLSSSSANSRGPTSSFFGGHFGMVFKERRTAEQDRLARASVAAAFEMLWAVPADGSWPLAYTRARLHAASSLLPEEAATAWWEHWHAPLTDNTDHQVVMADLITLHRAGVDPAQVATWWGGGRRGYGQPKELRAVSTQAASTIAAFLDLPQAARYAWPTAWDTYLSSGHVRLRDVAALASAGFTPTTAINWFTASTGSTDYRQARLAREGTPADARDITPAQARAYGRFAATGRWTLCELSHLGHALDPRTVATPPSGWARFDPRTAMLCVEAGLNAKEATALDKRGHLDSSALTLMAALRR